MSDNLRSKVIRLAHANPELRPELLPLLAKKAAGDDEKEAALISQLITSALEGLAGSYGGQLDARHAKFSYPVANGKQARWEIVFRSRKGDGFDSLQFSCIHNNNVQQKPQWAKYQGQYSFDVRARVTEFPNGVRGRGDYYDIAGGREGPDVYADAKDVPATLRKIVAKIRQILDAAGSPALG